MGYFVGMMNLSEAENGRLWVCFGETNVKTWNAWCWELETQGFERLGKEVVSFEEKIYKNFVRKDLALLAGSDHWAGNYLLATTPEADIFLEQLFLKMNAERKAAAYVILDRQGKVCVLRRANTGYEDGNFSLVAGHVEPGETLRECAVREAREEVGAELMVTDLRYFQTVFRDGDPDLRLDVFLVAKNCPDTVFNAEPHKCDALEWVGAESLPANTIGYVREVLERYFSLGGAASNC